MTGEQRGTPGSASRSYKDAALANLPPDFNKQPPIDPAMQKLNASLQHLLTSHPEGLTLKQVRRSCPQLLEPDILEGYPSVLHLLASMPKIVRLDGFGVQTRIFPAFP